MHRLIPRGGVLLVPLALAACGGRENSADSPQDSLSRRGTVQVRGANPDAQLAGGDTAVAVRAPQLTGEQAPGQPAASAAGPDAGATPAAAVDPNAPISRRPASTTPGPKSAQDQAVEVLQRAERAAAGVRSLEADFVQTLRVPLLGTDQRSSGKLYQRRPDRFAMRFTEPSGDVMVADGRYFWIYYPSSDKTQVIRTSVAEGSQQADFQKQFITGAATRFVPTLNGSENVAGRATWAITLVPRGESPYKVVRIWVDKEDDLIRRIEMTEENESVRTVELRNIRVNPTLGDAVFAFTPPAGTQVFDQ